MSDDPAVTAVEKHESSGGRYPVDDSSQHLGWDVSSYAEEGHQTLVRKIEVKGKRKTLKEFIRTQDLLTISAVGKAACEADPERSRLYLVAGLATPSPEVITISGRTLLEPNRLRPWLYTVRLGAQELREWRDA